MLLGCHEAASMKTAKISPEKLARLETHTMIQLHPNTRFYWNYYCEKPFFFPRVGFVFSYKWKDNGDSFVYYNTYIKMEYPRDRVWVRNWNSKIPVGDWRIKYGYINFNDLQNKARVLNAILDRRNNFNTEFWERQQQ
jgi:hypothetical protein